MVKLETFTDNRKVLVDGECKKIQSWAFVSNSYGVRLTSNVDFVIYFEDESKKRTSKIDSFENCD